MVKIEEMIDRMVVALKNDASPELLRLMLLGQGFSLIRAKTIIRWAKIKIEKEII